jgi:hypothetical protein
MQPQTALLAMLSCSLTPRPLPVGEGTKAVADSADISMLT